MSTPRRTAADLNAVRALLDTHGLRDTWLSLLAAHARLSHDPNTAAILLADSDYPDPAGLPEDLLAGKTVGQIAALYEFSLAHLDPAARKAAGQYFTPDDVADLLASYTDGFPPTAVWLDPCAGVGNLAHALARTMPDPEEFVAHRLVLTDLDPLALVLARGLLFLAFHRDRDTLLDDLRARSICDDFLTAELPRVDAAILNPPYGKADLRQGWITDKARENYALFLERLTRLGIGFVAITPHSLTHAGKHAPLRRLLLDTYPDLRVLCFDNIPDGLFTGTKHGSTNTNKANSVRAAITIAHPHGPQRREATPLLRWRTADRAHLLATASQHLTASPFTEACFPMLSADLVDLYIRATTSGWQPLSALLTEEETRWTLTVPATPRYYLSATIRDLDRGSKHVLHFATQADRDLVYPLLNSSYAYWWWRAHDGGITLTRTLLEGLPVPADLQVRQDLVHALRASEQENVVVKVNAGRANQNVAHPAVLRQRLNRCLFPGHGAALGRAHIPTCLPARTTATAAFGRTRPPR